MNYVEKRNEDIKKLFPTPISGNSFEARYSSIDFDLHLGKGIGPKNKLEKVDISRKQKKLKNHYLQHTGCCKQRKACKNCYKKIKAREGREIARNKTRKVSTFCKMCPEKPFLCSNCFEEYHSN